MFKKIGMVLLVPVMALFIALAGAIGPASATEPEEPKYVLAVWVSTSPDPGLWPQRLLTSQLQNEPDLYALDAQLPTCGVIQIDLYYNNDVTARLLSDGVLNGPGNPPEALAYVVKGDPWRVLYLGPCPPPKPEPEVVTSERSETSCEALTVTTFVTTTTTDWKLVDNAWVKDAPVTVETSSVRPATVEECPPPVVPPTETLAATGQAEDNLGVIAGSIAGGLLALGVVLLYWRAKDRRN